jgi:hypothetical protein
LRPLSVSVLRTLSTLVWAGGRIVTTDGREIPLSTLPIKFDNDGCNQSYGEAGAKRQGDRGIAGDRP